MKAQTVGVRESTGRILCCTIFQPGGRKLFGKGHVLSDDDVRLLETAGLNEVWVTELEEGEVGEDEASPNFSLARAGQRIATVKSAPFAVGRPQLEALIDILQERGPVLQARPIRNPSVAVLYTDPANGGRSRRLFEGIMMQRMEKFGAAVNFALACAEEEHAVARSLQHLLRANPTVILIASTTAPAGPEDVIGRAMVRAGCQLERFLAPVEPGILLLLGYKDEIPVISAPGCFRSLKPNVIDLLMPPMLARYRVSGWEIACLGHGGLLA
jgi:molybdenum cofactor cytidylyltransferase